MEEPRIVLMSKEKLDELDRYMGFSRAEKARQAEAKKTKNRRKAERRNRRAGRK